ncbi:MAG: hypothetical protein ABIQ16_21645 [Polyangiaceae bacterium]
MKIAARLLAQPIPLLVRVACYFALAGLTLMIASVLVPRPLVVIGAMSVGHGLGIAAFCSYLVSVLLDTARRGRVEGGAPKGSAKAAADTPPTRSHD